MTYIGPPDDWKDKARNDGTYAIAVCLAYIHVELEKIEARLSDAIQVLRDIRDHRW